MGWERGRYYTRSRKVGGRVTREYIGKGPAAKAAAALDQAARAEREAGRAARREALADLEALARPVEELARRALQLAAEELDAADFHRQKRGPWRKRRCTKS